MRSEIYAHGPYKLQWEVLGDRIKFSILTGGISLFKGKISEKHGCILKSKGWISIDRQECLPEIFNKLEELEGLL